MKAQKEPPIHAEHARTPTARPEAGLEAIPAVGRESLLRSQHVLALQRSAGNAAVVGLLAGQPAGLARSLRRAGGWPTVVQRNERSAGLLAKLATPRTFPGPSVEIQQALVKTLEEKITAEIERSHKSPVLFNNQFIGAVELTGIPSTTEREELLKDLMVTARLIDLPSSTEARKAAEGTNAPPKASHSLGTNLNRYALVKDDGGFVDGLIKNTLLTMIDAGQIEYLQESGIVGKDWRILVEIHYYRSREKNTPNFHKDTLGQTLFVNLNYVTDKPIAGPEFIVNPSPVHEHDEQTKASLPQEFTKDLAAMREGTRREALIRASDIPEHGVVAFVDEAIHHMTPHLGHREISGGELEAFLRTKHGDLVDKAKAAYAKYSNSYGLWGFSSYFKDVPPEDADKWYTWMKMADEPTEKFKRPDFMGVMSHEEIDTMLAHPESLKGYQQVNIPSSESTKINPGKTLTREMSQRALKKQVPPEVEGDRRFFRTWVRAVPNR